MRTPAIGALALLTLAGCTAQPVIEAETYYVREGMVHQINPPTEAIWNMQVEVMDDLGNFDPALMDAGKWASLLDAARQLEAASLRMSLAGRYIVADPDGSLTQVPEGTDLAAIQARLSASPEAYRAYSQALTTHARQLVEAAGSRNAQEFTRLTNDLQPVCKACHDVFWYPEEQ